MREQAQANLGALRKNPYPGRGIVVGLDHTWRHMIQVYWIMGRSENSRNRVFSYERGRVFTEPADPAKVKDSSLIIYNAMDEQEGCFVVSNGDQTDTVTEALAAGKSFQTALETRIYEPDDPNFTPRITAISYIGPPNVPVMQVSSLRKSPASTECERDLYTFNGNLLCGGIGYCVTTYSGDGNPLPSFRGKPYFLPLQGGMEEIGETLWDALNPENRVSLAVKRIKVDNQKSKVWIKNRFTKVA